MKELKITSTSRGTANVEDIVLCETGSTRRVLRAQLIDNQSDAKKSVKVSLIHQRKRKDDKWEDFPSKPFSAMKADEEAKFNLNTAETRELALNLYYLYKSFQELGGVPWGETSLTVAPTQRVVVTPETLKATVQGLVDSGLTQEVWDELSASNPSLTERLCHARLQQARIEALKEFKNALDKDKGEQEFWDDFFNRNTWIFGYGLEYRFLNTLQSQPNYGGRDVTREGEQKGDYLTASEGDARFTVLVEIKAPGTDLLKKTKTRSGGFPVSSELASGVTQVQVNCRTWDNEGSRTERNREILGPRNVHTVEPKGILVIGRMSELDDNDKRNSFELFRRNIFNPEIVTFDELYQRAEFIVQHIDDSEKPTLRE